jgi:hypothetical protein
MHAHLCNLADPRIPRRRSSSRLSYSRALQGSIRLLSDDGTTGMTVGEWLIHVGLDINRSVLLSTVTAPRRRFSCRRSVPPAHLAAAFSPTLPSPTNHHHQHSHQSGPRTPVRKVHRPDCTCIICKQARRKSSDGPYVPISMPRLLPLLPHTDKPRLHKHPGRPEYRIGKHAFLDSTPYLPRGCAPPGESPLHMPASRAWDPEEWSLYWSIQRDVQAARENNEAQPNSESTPPETCAQQQAVDPALESALQPPGPRSILPKVVQKGTLAQLGIVRPDDSSRTWRLAVTSLQDKVQICHQTMRERLTINKSGIHGWGMTALQDIPQVGTSSHSAMHEISR